jgi:uncharacterized protein (DUF3084 family)
MSDKSSVHANYLRDVGLLLKERALQAQRDRVQAPSEFEDGRVMAYYEVISLLRNEAETFGLGPDDLQLHDIDPDRDLIQIRPRKP